ncbi:MAG: universal stress protein [Verrucomicrobiales bacterium]|nr:universal stress protein [Verrucomicrobiales bacterium]
MDRLVVESLLHPTDFSETDSGAVAHALKIALAAKAKLTFLHVGQKGTDVDWADFPQIRKVLAAWGVVGAEAGQEEVLATGMQVRKSLRKGEDVVAEIVGEAGAGDADLIVLATHQRQGVARWLSKPLAETIAREARKPTLFVPRQVEGFVRRETGHLHFDNVLIPIAKHPRPKHALEVATGLAGLLGARPVTFSLLFVGPQDRRPKVETPQVEGWTFREVSGEGDVVGAILDESEEVGADLIVMATDGREGFLDALRGTTTEQVLRGAKCPLLAVPA